MTGDTLIAWALLLSAALVVAVLAARRGARWLRGWVCGALVSITWIGGVRR